LRLRSPSPHKGLVEIWRGECPGLNQTCGYEQL
jgi:hypothetical protein